MSCELKTCMAPVVDELEPPRCEWHRIVYGTANLDTHVVGLAGDGKCVYCGEKNPATVVCPASPLHE